MRFRGDYADADGDGDVWPLCRLRYTGTTDRWGFAIHLASRDGYEDFLLPNGQPVGTPEEAIDCACGRYLGDPTAWSWSLKPRVAQLPCQLTIRPGVPVRAPYRASDVG